jgi:trehalose-phosphatase
VAVLSGRSFDDLVTRAEVGRHVTLIGSHGAEVGAPLALDTEQAALAASLRREVVGIAERLGQGLRVEDKATGPALHYRGASDDVAHEAVIAVEKGPATWPGVTLRRGKKVVELSVLATSKGDALQALRDGVGATVVVFIGDDETDEDAFAVLGPHDVGVKVGAGPTIAGVRACTPDDVAVLLGLLATVRRAPDPSRVRSAP